MRNLLQVENLHVEFKLLEGVLRAVKGVSFRVRPGATVALVGESGSGKTVLSQAVMGILPRAARITQGAIRFFDPAAGGRETDIAQLPPDGATMRGLRGGRISIIFQEPMTSLSPLHTIGDQVSEALHLHRPVDRREALALTEDMLRLVEFPDPRGALARYPFELSGGLRQRAMIAMALVCRPALLIADEPTTALDVTIQAQILRLLRRLQGELGMAVLIITHDLGVVANLAEEVVVLYRGEVMESGPLRPLFAAPRHPYLRALLQAVPRFHLPPGTRLTPLREIKAETGRLLEAATEPWPSDAAADAPLLTVAGVSKWFGNRRRPIFGSGGAAAARTGGTVAVDDVSFEIRRGECLGLVGESGCGKTTLNKILMRALTPDTGTIRFNDRGRIVDVLSLKGPDLMRFRRRVQFVFQDPFGSLNPRMTAGDILTEPLAIHGIGDAEHRRGLVRELMELVGLDVRHLKRYPHSFSGGQRQRIGIARALALRPDLILCDEPVSALDVSIQAQILNLLKDLQARLQLTLLFVSHNLAVVDYIADRIMVMCRGRIVEVAPRATLFREPVHPYTRSLLAAVPEPDPAYPLNFDGLQACRASDPCAWPAPFTAGDGRWPHLITLGDGHWVCATESPAGLG